MSICIFCMPGAKAESLETELAPWRVYWEQYNLPGELEIFTENGLSQKTWDRIADIVIDKGKEGIQKAAKMCCSMIAMASIAGLCHTVVHQDGLRQETLWAQNLVATAMALGYAMPMMRVMEDALTAVAGFVSTVSPAVTVALAASGRETVAGLVSPLGTALVTLISNWMKPVLIWGAGGGMVVTAFDGINEHHPLSGLTEMAHHGIQWFLGLSLTAMGGVIGIRSIVAMNYDSIWMRTARYAVDHGISGIGGALADLLNITVSNARITCTGMGVAGILIVLAMVLNPALEIGMMMLTFKVGAAVGGALGEGTVSQCWQGQIRWLSVMLCGLITVVVLALATVSWLCFAGNG